MAQLSTNGIFFCCGPRFVCSGSTEIICHTQQIISFSHYKTSFSALTLLVGHQKEHLACKSWAWWGVSGVICLQWEADCLHMVQLPETTPKTSPRGQVLGLEDPWVEMPWPQPPALGLRVMALVLEIKYYHLFFCFKFLSSLFGE